MTEDELAEALRAVTARYGRWYVAAEPNYAAARRALELRDRELLGAGAFNPRGIAEIPLGDGRWLETVDTPLRDGGGR